MTNGAHTARKKPLIHNTKSGVMSGSNGAHTHHYMNGLGSKSTGRTIGIDDARCWWHRVSLG